MPHAKKSQPQADHDGESDGSHLPAFLLGRLPSKLELPIFIIALPPRKMHMGRFHIYTRFTSVEYRSAGDAVRPTAAR